MYVPPLSRVSWVWERQPSYPSSVPLAKVVVEEEARGRAVLRRTALVQGKVTGRGCVRRVRDVPIGGRRGLEEGLALGGCRDAHQGIWQPPVL